MHNVRSSNINSSLSLFSEQENFDWKSNGGIHGLGFLNFILLRVWLKEEKCVVLIKIPLKHIATLDFCFEPISSKMLGIGCDLLG